MIYFGIPTYHRCEKQTTLDYLEKVGVKREQVIMSVQTEEDYKKYKEKGYHLRVGELVYKKGRNLSENANTIFDCLSNGERIIIVDDDIKAVSALKDGELIDIFAHDEFMKFVETGYTIANHLKTIGFSVYPCHNSYFMSNSFNKAHIGEGTFLALTKTKIRFDPRFDTKCDYEITSKIISVYGAFPRLNMFSCNAPHYTKGGCEENWNDRRKVISDARALVELYPDIVKANERRIGEVLMKPRKDKVAMVWK